MDFNLKIVKQILDSALAFLGKKITGASDSVVKSIEKANDKLIAESKSNTTSQTKALGSAVGELKKLVEKVQNPTFTGEVALDSSAFAEELDSIVETIQEIEMPSLEPIERGLQILINKVEALSDNKKVVELLMTIEKTLANKKLEVPKTISIETSQFRELRNAGRGSGGMSTAGVLQARSVTHTNLALTSTSSEYSYTFPANTLSWVIKLRDQGTLLYYAFATGKLPTSGDGLLYSTAPQGFIRSQSNIEWGGKTIYLGAESASMVAEIEAYTA